MRSLTLLGVLGLALLQIAGCPTMFEETTRPGARITSSLGTIDIELDTDAAATTATAFVQFISAGLYDNTVFHRVSPAAFVQGGCYEAGLVAKQTRDPIANEADNGRLNVRGSVAMARTDEPDSATAQFFVNLVDNTALDATDENPGYAVFGRVVEGMDVVDQIGAVETETRGDLAEVPVEDVVIESVRRTDLTGGDAGVQAARVTTTLGTFVIELFATDAPNTVANFLQYVDDEFYDGTVFHRVVPDFVVQGGGYEPGVVGKAATPAEVQPTSELENTRGTIGLAVGADSESIAPCFVLNLATNTGFDRSDEDPGYAVFGRVVEGLDVVEQIAGVATEQQGELADVPKDNVLIQSVEYIDIPQGTWELTDEGEEYLDYKNYQILNAVRDLVIDVLAFFLAGG